MPTPPYAIIMSPTGGHAMSANYKQWTDFLIEQGIDKVEHSQKTYLGHLVSLFRLMEAEGCSEEACRAGLFHSIYGTELFQGFKLPLESRAELCGLIGDRAERLAYVNCAMDRQSLDDAVAHGKPPFTIKDRLAGQEVELTSQEFDDLCRVHLYDWLE